jgi:hypothetical protein
VGGTTAAERRRKRHEEALAKAASKPNRDAEENLKNLREIGLP